MVRFILGHAAYQSAVIFTLIFKGPEIFGFPAHHSGYDNLPSIHYTMVCVCGAPPQTQLYMIHLFKSIHLPTNQSPITHPPPRQVFHTFVVCQLFNEVNARKMHGEWNVFSGLLRNPLYLAIMAFQVFALFLLAVLFFSFRVYWRLLLAVHVVLYYFRAV